MRWLQFHRFQYYVVIEQGVYELKPVGAKMCRILSAIHYGYIGVPIDLYTDYG